MGFGEVSATLQGTSPHRRSVKPANRTKRQRRWTAKECGQLANRTCWHRWFAWRPVVVSVPNRTTASGVAPILRTEMDC